MVLVGFIQTDYFPLQIFFFFYLLDGFLLADVTAPACFHYIANPR